jgi:bacillithiol biosynthesis deacetylase BshB1
VSVDVLLFGAHPDDVEWGAGGIMLLLRQARVSFAIVDLTNGEMGSRGTEEERIKEAQEAAAFVGASERVSLNFPDCGLVDSPETRRHVAGAIRRFRPSIVLAPFWKDRHPDHEAAGTIVRKSLLYSTLVKANDPNPPHKPDTFLYFLLRGFRSPSFAVDISSVQKQKMELLKIHRSQFARTAEQYGILPTGLGDYLFSLESRDRFFGTLIGTHYAEALVADRPMKLTSLHTLLGLAQPSEVSP